MMVYQRVQWIDLVAGNHSERVHLGNQVLLHQAPTVVDASVCIRKPALKARDGGQVVRGEFGLAGKRETVAEEGEQ